MSDRAAAALSLKLEFILSGNIAKDYFKKYTKSNKAEDAYQGRYHLNFIAFHLLNL